MSLEATVAAPFKWHATDRLGEGAFVVALSLEREWFSPDQAKRLVAGGAGGGFVVGAEGDWVGQLDPEAGGIRGGCGPEEDGLREQSAFETALEAAVATGVDKQTAVAAINERQQALAVTIEAAAVLYAKRRDARVDHLAEAVRETLGPEA